MICKYNLKKRFYKIIFVFFSVLCYWINEEINKNEKNKTKIVISYKGEISFVIIVPFWISTQFEVEKKH